MQVELGHAEVSRSAQVRGPCTFVVACPETRIGVRKNLASELVPLRKPALEVTCLDLVRGHNHLAEVSPLVVHKPKIAYELKRERHVLFEGNNHVFSPVRLNFLHCTVQCNNGKDGRLGSEVARSSAVHV